MRTSIRLITLIGCLVIVGLGHVASADTAESLRVQNLSFNTTPDGLTVYIKTTESLTNYRCDLNPSPSQEGLRMVVVDFPGAEADVESFSDVVGDLIQSANVERSTGDGHGVRIRFMLDQGALVKLEEVSRGLLLYFARTAGHNGSWTGEGEEAYRLGVGDELEISVFGHEDLHRMTEVRADGTINYPLLGDIQVAGETVSEVKELLTSGLARDYLVDPQVNVEVREYRSQWVTVIGAIRSPSRYVLVRHMRLIDLLAAAGGLSAEAGSDIIITRRNSSSDDGRQIVVSRDELFSRDNDAANIVLLPADIVTVSEREFFYIRGEVQRPDAYIYKKGMTVLKAISIAGGFSQFANRKEVELLRTDKSGVHAKTIVNIKAIENGKQEDIQLLPEDMIVVPRRIF